MDQPALIKGRYQIKDVLGRGGMGVVYKAHDTLMRRDVAVKTLRDAPDSMFVDLFYRECSVLAAMVHPNVVEIFDMGEFDERGISKPYFVMPLLPGRTLYDLIYPATQPLLPERCVDIISQACRGLQAAHDRGLLHRDIKPRNIFVMGDDAVKLIDFGVAQLLGASHSTGMRGTLHYMAPEQITLKPLSNRSDIFSLATVCYEALTAVHPFVRNSEADIAAAITEHTPVLASSVNASVSRNLAQVVAQAMAKDPRNRFESAAAFADALQRGLRSEAATSPKPSLNVQGRIERARRSFLQKDYQFALEILQQLASEGNNDAEVAQLRRELDHAIQEEQTGKWLESARRCIEEEEYGLAQRKIQDVLDISATNAAALALKKDIEDRLAQQKVAHLLNQASEKIAQTSFAGARQLVLEALRLRPNDTQAQALLVDIDTKQKDVLRQRQEQERLYQAAQAAWLEGRIEPAMENLEHLAKLASGDSRDRAGEYKEFYKRVRGEHDALAAALTDTRNLLETGQLSDADRLCDRFLSRYPKHPEFDALKRDVGRRRQEAEQSFRQDVADKLEREPNLEARVAIIEQALTARPGDARFRQEADQIRHALQQADGYVRRAREFDKRGEHARAMGEWSALGQFYPAFPGLQEQINQTQGLWDQQRAKAKNDLFSKVKAALDKWDLATAAKLLAEAEAKFPDDADIESLQRQRAEKEQRVTEVNCLLRDLANATEARDYPNALGNCRAAIRLSNDDGPLRSSVFYAVLEQAGKVMPESWTVAEAMLQEAAKSNSGLSIPQSYLDGIQREKRNEEIAAILALAHGTFDSDPAQSRDVIAKGLKQFPEELSLRESLTAIDAALATRRQAEEKRACLARLDELQAELEEQTEARGLRAIAESAHSAATAYPQDAQVISAVTAIARQVRTFEQAAQAYAQQAWQESRHLCQETLERYPNHRAFILLLEDVGLREREVAAQYLEHVERQLAAETNLDRRAEIIEKANRDYCNEPHFQEELTLVRNEQNLVRGVADKAKDLEAQGLFHDALEQWQHMETVYRAFPGLEGHIARCSNAIDRRERRTNAETLLTQGRNDLAADRFAEGHRRLREAHDLAAGVDADLIKSIAKSLVHFSREALRVSARQAEMMLTEAQAMDPSTRISKDLRASIAEGKRREELEECLAAIKAYEEAGDPELALDVAREYLMKVPGQKQIEGIKARLAAVHNEAVRKEERQRDLEALNAVDNLSQTAATKEHVLDLLKRTKAVASRNEQDPEFSRNAQRLAALLASLAEAKEHLREQRIPEAETAYAKAHEEFPEHAAVAGLRAEIENRKVELASDYLRDVEQRLSKEHDWDKQEQILQAAAARYPHENYYAEELTLVRNNRSLFQSQVARAKDLDAKGLAEEAQQQWEMLRQMYPWHGGVSAEATRLDGEKQRAAEKERRRANALQEVAAFATEVETATKKKQLVALQQRFSATRLAHSADDEVRKSAAALAQKIESKLEMLDDGSDQSLERPTAKGPLRLVMVAVAAILISLLAYFSLRPKPNASVPLLLDVQPTQVSVSVDAKTCVTPDCKFSLASGKHKIRFEKNGFEAKEVDVEIQAGETTPVRVSAVLKPLPPVVLQSTTAVAKGSLVIEPNIPNVNLVINDKPYQGTAAGGPLVIELPPGSYELRASHPGYSDFGPVSVAVKRDVTSNVKVLLEAKPGSLAILGAATGTAIRIDGEPAGVVRSRRKSTVLALVPGRHVIDLSRPGYLPRRMVRVVGPGDSASISGEEVELTAAPPDQGALEEQGWKQASGGTLAQFEEFLRNYPGGTHAGEATARMQELRWDAVDKKNSNSLQAFVKQNPNNPNVGEARRILQGLQQAEIARVEALNEMAKAELTKANDDNAWRSVDTKNRNSVQNYLTQFPNGRHRAQAEQILASLATPPPASAPATQAPPAVVADDSGGIRDALQGYANAWNNKRLDEILARNLSLKRRVIKDQLDPVEEMHMSITPVSSPHFDGDTAVVTCRRQMRETFKDGKTPPPAVDSDVTVVLIKRNGGWVIQSMN